MTLEETEVPRILSISAATLDGGLGQQSLELGDFDVAPGQVIGIIHPSSLNLTSFSDFLLGLETVSGRCSFLGRDWNKLRERVSASLRWQIGWVHDPPQFLSNVPVDNNIQLALRYHTKLTDGEIVARCQDTKAQLNLDQPLMKTPGGYSYHVLRMAELVRATVPRGQLLVIENVERTFLESGYSDVFRSLIDRWTDSGGAILMMTSRARNLLDWTDDLWALPSQGHPVRGGSAFIRNHPRPEISRLIGERVDKTESESS